MEPDVPDQAADRADADRRPPIVVAAKLYAALCGLLVCVGLGILHTMDQTVRAQTPVDPATMRAHPDPSSSVLGVALVAVALTLIFVFLPRHVFGWWFGLVYFLLFVALSSFVLAMSPFNVVALVFAVAALVVLAKWGKPEVYRWFEGG